MKRHVPWDAPPMGRRLFRFVLGLGLAVAAVLVAFLARLALDRYLAGMQPFSLFYIAAAVVAWWSGWRAALVSVLLGYLIGDWFFISPRRLGIENTAHLVEFLTYFGVTGTIIALITSLRAAKRRADASADRAQSKQRELEIEIGQRQQAEAALAQSHQELERLVQQRTTKLRESVDELEHFSYAIVHDMRAPLRAICNFAALQEEECGGCPAHVNREYFDRIKIAASRMDRLIIDSLSYSKAVRQEMPMQPVDLEEVLRGLLKTYPNLQPDRADIRLESPLPQVLGNETALAQCFSNLLDNAVKFVTPGTKPLIRLWAEPQPGTVRIWIADNGIGIAESFQPRIFGMFERGSNQFEGTGIGLAIVRKVVERMGGRVGVESAERAGSRFWVELRRPDRGLRPDQPT